MDELWLPSVEFPDYYDVSSFGRVRNKSGYVLAQNLHKTNCWRVRLCIRKNKFSRSVHRMVAQAFIPNPEDKPEVNHIDGDRLNNNIDNLEWVTKRENMDHAVRTGLINNEFGEDARNFKGTTRAWKDGVCYFEMNGNKEIMEAGFCYKQVSACILGKQKTCKGYYFTRGE